MLDLVKIDLRDGLDELTIDLIDKVEVDSAPPLLQDKTVNPSTSSQTITADGGYTGLNSVKINAVTSSIDANIQPSNIKKDVTILGVTGTLESGVGVEQNYVTAGTFRNCNITSYKNLIATSVASNAFYNNYYLNYIYLGNASLCTLANVNAFTGAGTSNDNPSHVIYVYVPSGLISTYQTATNWSTLYNNGQVEFLAIP